MPRLAICNRDLHWQWINWAPLYDTMEVSMLRLTWLTVAQHVFQPALTGRLELISRKIVSCEPGTKAIAVSRFREKLSPANWVQGVTAISRKISRSWAPKKWGPTCDRDISNSAIYATAIYRAYTVLCKFCPSTFLQLSEHHWNRLPFFDTAPLFSWFTIDISILIITLWLVYSVYIISYHIISNKLNTFFCCFLWFHILTPYNVIHYFHLPYFTSVRLLYPCPTKLDGGILDSPCPSVLPLAEAPLGDDLL